MDNEGVRRIFEKCPPQFQGEIPGDALNVLSMVGTCSHCEWPKGIKARLEVMTT